MARKVLRRKRTVQRRQRTDDGPIPDPVAMARMFTFMRERHNAYYERKVLGLAPPWGRDDVVAGTFFTNVYRRLDPGTQFALGMLGEVDGYADKAWRALMYRLAFKESTMRALCDAGLGVLDTFESPLMRQVLRDIQGPFTGAYVVSNYGKKGSKVDVITDVLCGIHAKLCEARADGTLYAMPDRAAWMDYCERSLHGIGRFIAFQALVDLCYPGPQRGYPFSNDGLAVAGPGAIHGLKKLYPDTQVTPRNSDGLLATLVRLHRASWLRTMKPWVRGGGRIPVDRSDMQNCCCEFSKYERVRTGGRSKRNFDPRASRLRDLEEKGHGAQLEID